MTTDLTPSPACDSEGLLGYTSTRCHYRYLGCQDRACVCRCHDQAQPITDDCCDDCSNICGVVDTKRDACCDDCPEFATTTRSGR